MLRCLLSLALALPLTGALPPPVPVSEFNTGVTMRDGVRLSTNVFRPTAAGRYPTILLRTPYGKGEELTPTVQTFLNHGYAYVIQDVRGRYQSEGRFEPINQEVNDGDDTLNWIARQPWSDGNVGMYGGSYLGIAQWKAALSHNPHLKAIFPYVSGDDDYRDRFYSSGGAMKLGHRLLWVSENLRDMSYRPPAFSKYIWSLPVRYADIVAAGRAIPLWQLAANHPSYDSFWKNSSVREHLKDIHIPVYSVGGWYDNFVESDLEAFQVLSRENHNVRIMIGPWPHTFNTPFPNVSFGGEAATPLRPEQLAWFDRWVKRGPKKEDLKTVDTEHPVRIFVMGVNRWRDEEEWPLARARNTKFYLGRAGVLDEEPPRNSSADTFVYDPKNPVPTMGGAVCCDPKIYRWGPLDQRGVEKRRDVLVYSTAPLVSGVEVTGPVKAVLYISSSAPDTDFTAKLVDVFPNGEARNLTDGILRVRYRDSLEQPTLMKPGGVYRITVDAGVTSNVFQAGHRIRLEISSSNFPRFDRNPNTGRPVADEKELRKATQKVFHDRERRSFVLLPVVPARRTQLTSTHATRYVTNRTSTKAR
ncbi:MAG: CocE/NonD family hydrolase [Acidobacteriota bacterium]